MGRVHQLYQGVITQAYRRSGQCQLGQCDRVLEVDGVAGVAETKVWRDVENQ